MKRALLLVLALLAASVLAAGAATAAKPSSGALCSIQPETVQSNEPWTLTASGLAPDASLRIAVSDTRATLVYYRTLDTMGGLVFTAVTLTPEGLGSYLETVTVQERGRLSWKWVDRAVCTFTALEVPPPPSE